MWQTNQFQKNTQTSLVLLFWTVPTVRPWTRSKLFLNPIIPISIWTYLLSWHPCWSQHFASLLLQTICMSVFTSRRLVLTFDLNPAAEAVGRSRQQLDGSQTFLCSVEEVSPSRYKTLQREGENIKWKWETPEIRKRRKNWNLNKKL